MIHSGDLLSIIPLGAAEVSNRSDNPHRASVQPLTGGHSALILRMVIEKIPFFAISLPETLMILFSQVIITMPML